MLYLYYIPLYGPLLVLVILKNIVFVFILCFCYKYAASIDYVDLLIFSMCHHSNSS